MAFLLWTFRSGILLAY